MSVLEIEGLSELVNLENVRKDVNISKIEDSFKDIKLDIDEEKEYVKIIEETEKKLGIDIEYSNSVSYDSVSVASTSSSRSKSSYKSTRSSRSSRSGKSSVKSGYKTKDAERHKKMEHVMRKLKVESNNTLDNLKREDAKANMVEEIDYLRHALTESGQTVIAANIVTTDSSYEEIEGTLKLLRRMSDRVKYSTMAEELLMVGVTGIEYVFDGSREIFGFKPDMRGWSTVVNTKLARMRYSTSEIMANFVQDNGVSPLTCVIIELLPSALLYNRNEKDTFDNTELNNAFSNI